MKSGKNLRLDASKSFDSDGDKLSFSWWQQPEIGGVLLEILNADNANATVKNPSDVYGKTFHVICEVHDNGKFNLVAYKRVIVKVE